MSIIPDVFNYLIEVANIVTDKQLVDDSKPKFNELKESNKHGIILICINVRNGVMPNARSMEIRTIGQFGIR